MKTRYAFFAACFFLLAANLKAQDSAELKIGYTNVNYILGLLPESAVITAEINSYQSQLQTQLETKYREFQDKLNDYQQKASTGEMIPDVMKEKEAELSSMRDSIQKFQSDANTSIRNKQAELLKPAYDKIQNAINEVARENGYTHVFSYDLGSFPVLLYIKDEDNLTDLILAKLGIQPPVTSESTQTEK